MSNTAPDLKSFYNSKLGRLVRRIVQKNIREFWPDINGLELVGCGYAVPYLRTFKNEASRITAMMPAQNNTAAQNWPHDGLNCVCLSDPLSRPIESNSVDRILVIHDLEFSSDSHHYLQEISRILKSNGRVLFIVPNRSGLWAHAENTPFGHGTPYSLAQICTQIEDASLRCERTQEALFVPPVKFTPFLKYAGSFEKIGSKILPIAAGVHMIEASKETYARITPSSGSKIPTTRKRPSIFIPNARIILE